MAQSKTPTARKPRDGSVDARLETTEIETRGIIRRLRGIEGEAFLGDQVLTEGQELKLSSAIENAQALYTAVRALRAPTRATQDLAGGDLS